MSLLLLLQSLQSPTSGVGVIINPLSFGGGFDWGFETQNRLLISGNYNVEIPLVYVSGSGTVTTFPTALSGSYGLITPSFILGTGQVNKPTRLNSNYNLSSPTFVTEGQGLTVSAETVSASYNIESPDILIQLIIPVDILDSTYNLISPSNVVEGFGANAFDYNPTNATYNLNTATVSTAGQTRVDVDSLSASYQLNSPIIESGFGITIPTDYSSLNYNLLSANALFGTRIVANNLSASYSVKTPSIFGSSIYIPNILSATYNSKDVSIRVDTRSLASILSATYQQNSSNIIAGLGLVTSAGNLSAQYNIDTISIKSSVKNLSNILSASYNIENSIVRGNSNTSADSLDAIYQLINPNITVQTVVTGNSLSAIYNIEDSNIITQIQYTFSADVCSATYNINSPEVIIAIPEWFNCPQVPFNSYWRDDTECKDNERFLYNSLLTDSYNKFAPIWQYYPTTYNLTTDRVFKEDSNRQVIRCFSASGFIEDIPAEHRSYKLEGLVGNDIVRAWFSQVHFTEASTYSGLSPNIYPSWSPAVGDYLYLTSNGLFYEVINVNDAVELFMNRSHNWELVMRVYRDNKLTVSAGSPTLTDDVILQVCTSAASATTQFNDYLEINEDLDELIKPIEYNEKQGEQSVNPFGGW